MARATEMGTSYGNERTMAQCGWDRLSFENGFKQGNVPFPAGTTWHIMSQWECITNCPMRALPG